MSLRRIGIVIGALFAVFGWVGAAQAADEYGIFERVLEASGSFEETTAALEKSLAESKLTLQGKEDLKIPDGIQKARVYILTSPSYMEAAKDLPPNTISAQILRIGVYEYGEGKKTHINMANPIAHAMVFYAGTDQYPQMIAAAKAAAQEIKAVVATVPGTQTSAQLEPTRTEKALNKFNGDGPAKMMAKFRNWSESQNLVFNEKPENFAATVTKVETLLNASKDKGADDASGWNLISKVAVGPNAVYFGISNAYTENKAVRINSDFRSDGKTKDAPYPGVDHAPALPLEVLVINTGKDVQVVQYGEMWRMQLYFWDSGYLAFTKNTLVPNTIFGSIDKVLTATK
jgi:hypothetical protein